MFIQHGDPASVPKHDELVFGVRFERPRLGTIVRQSARRRAVPDDDEQLGRERWELVGAMEEVDEDGVDKVGVD